MANKIMKTLTIGENTYEITPSYIEGNGGVKIQTYYSVPYNSDNTSEEFGLSAITEDYSRISLTHKNTDDPTQHKITYLDANGNKYSSIIYTTDNPPSPPSNATTTAAGLMSAEDKVKLNGIATGANKITVDSALNSTSTNPVQNKVVNTAIANVESKANEALAKSGVTSVNGSNGDVTVRYTLGESGVKIQGYYSTQDPNNIQYGLRTTNTNDGSTITLYRKANDAPNTVMLSYKEADKTGNIGTIYTSINPPNSTKISTGGSEGQICAVNANGTISPSSRTIASLGTGATYSLSGTTLTITTL